MPLVINTNIASLGVQHRLDRSQAGAATALQRLSSGLRINSARDDAAGLAVSERMSAQLRGTHQALRNVNDGISMFQTGEHALGEMTDRLQRMRELAVQSLNGTNAKADRASLDGEVQQSLAEVQRTASSTSFNGRKLLDGSAGLSQFQIGAGSADTLDIDLSTDLRTDQLGAIATARTADLRTTSGGGGGGFAFAGTYTTVALRSLDFSRPDVPLTPGSATATPSTVNYGGAGQAATFTVDGVTVTLNTNYGSLGGVAGAVQSQLNSAQSGAYSVSQDGTHLTVTKTSRAGNPAAAVAIAAVSGANATAFGNAAGHTGIGASRNTHAGFSVDGHRVSLTTDFNGNMAGLLSEIKGQLSNRYKVVGSQAGISILHASDDGVVPVVGSFTDNGIDSFGRGPSSSLTLQAGDLTVKVGTRAVVSITGSFTTPESLAQAVQSRVPGVVANINQDTGALEINAVETVTVGGTQAGGSGALAFTQAVNEPEGSLADVDVLERGNANTALLRIDAAMNTLGAQRGQFGALLSRFDAVVGSLQSTEEVLGASRGRIVDADYATETATLASSTVLRNAGMAMLSMVNVGPQGVLTLLQSLR